MAVLFTCKFEDDSIKSESAILPTTFSPLYVYGKFFHHSRANNFKVNSPIWPKIKLVRDVINALVTCKFDEDTLKNEVGILRTIFFPHYKSSFQLQWKPEF